MTPRPTKAFDVDDTTSRDGVRVLATPPGATGHPLIRPAGLADIPPITRITQGGPQPPELELGARPLWTRLFLAQVVLEYGALWVEQAGAGQFVRAMIALPAGQLSLPGSGLGVAIRRLGEPPTARHAPGFSQELMGELTAVRPGWLLSEISRQAPRSGDRDLLEVGLAWVHAQSAAHEPVAVLAHWAHERTAAQGLGFVERRTWAEPLSLWLGATVPAHRALRESDVLQDAQPKPPVSSREHPSDG